MQSGSTPKVQDYFSDLETPDLLALQPQLEQLVQQGILTPEDAQAALAERSDMNGITLDPNLKKAQMDALTSLQDISSSGGMTTMDKANLSRIQSEEDAAARGSREAILQNAQARGMGSSGLELMSQMQNQQASVGRRAQRDLDVAGMAQQRALEALMQSGNMAGSMRGQDFSEQSQVAQANDEISKFNTANKQQVNLMNVNARNAAQAENLNNKQGIHNANVGTRNQQQQQKLDLAQQQFNNQLSKRGGQSGVATTNAQIQGQNSQNQANAHNATVGAGLSFINPFLGAAHGAASKKKQEGMKDGGIVDGDPTDYDSEMRMLQPGEFVTRKEDVPEMLKKMHTDEDGEFDASAFLDSLTGHKFNYKGKK